MTETTTHRAARSGGFDHAPLADRLARLQEIDLCCRVVTKLVADPDIQVQACSGRSVWGHVTELYTDLADRP
ncbi:MAG: hypothetical protein ACRDRB_05180 [Pseudonocardiaceae bacterium]